MQSFLKRGIDENNIWISQERKMCCGIGKCGHCKIDDTYICLDGPVFQLFKRQILNRLGGVSCGFKYKGNQEKCF